MNFVSKGSVDEEENGPTNKNNNMQKKPKEIWWLYINPFKVDWETARKERKSMRMTFEQFDTKGKTDQEKKE